MDIDRFVASAATSDRSTAIVYTPVKQDITLDLKGWKPGLNGRWYDPRTGTPGEMFNVTSGGKVTLSPPGEKDWVLVLQP
jgi:hypothetical protein